MEFDPSFCRVFPSNQRGWGCSRRRSHQPCSVATKCPRRRQGSCDCGIWTILPGSIGRNTKHRGTWHMARPDDHRPDPPPWLCFRPSFSCRYGSLEPLYGPHGQRRATRQRCSSSLVWGTKLVQRRCWHDWKILRRQHTLASCYVWSRA